MQFGVIAHTLKKNEKRVPIHPEHLASIPQHLRDQLVFESGYGERFGWSDAQMQNYVRQADKATLFNLDGVILLKPQAQDLKSLKSGGILWGWPHCVQQSAPTQVAIERKQTLIAFEAMFAKGPEGKVGMHTFYKNNEIAGYAALMHGLALKGTDGRYGRQRKALIFGYGSVSRGAIYGLQARGYTDITICILRPSHLVKEEVLGCKYKRLIPDPERPGYYLVAQDFESPIPLISLVAESDIIVNGIFQNPNKPITFVHADQIDQLKTGSLILDVSCDENMGFAGAKPTSFDDPMFKLGAADYYAVDHTPTYLWESTSWELSKAIMPFLDTVLNGPKAWGENRVIKDAIEIQDGVIKNPAILDFQNRSKTYPHEKMT